MQIVHLLHNSSHLIHLFIIIIVSLEQLAISTRCNIVLQRERYTIIVFLSIKVAMIASLKKIILNSSTTGTL